MEAMTMGTPLQVTFRNMDPAETVRAAIQKQAAKLDRLGRRVTGCRVMVESPHNHHQQGRRFHVRLDLTAPGTHAAEHAEDENVYVAIRDAFRAGRRALGARGPDDEPRPRRRREAESR
jgi:ribosome-associated translation inhibitor RaiA